MNQLHFVYPERAWIELPQLSVEALSPSPVAHALAIFAFAMRRYHLVSAKFKIKVVSYLGGLTTQDCRQGGKASTKTRLLAGCKRNSRKARITHSKSKRGTLVPKPVSLPAL